MIPRRMSTFNPRSLPVKAAIGGFVYVVKFSTDLIKIGYTKVPQRRILNHHGHALPFDITVTDHWVSAEHAHFLESESRLIGLAKKLGGEARRVEYFKGVNPNALLNAFGDYDQAHLKPAFYVTDDPEERAVLDRARRDHLRGVQRS